MKLNTGARSIISTFLLAGLVLGVSSCGGGGGAPNSAPTASSVNIVDDNGGTFVEGDSLTGNYTYADTNNDAEGTSTYRWLRGGVAISGATSVTYTLVSADISQSITFEVTPIAATGTTTGSLVTSSAIVLINTSLATAARGYYDGSATINGGANFDVTTTAGIQGIFDEKGFVIAYKGNDDNAAAIVLLYKGTFTEVSATSFKASVRVYVNGIYQITSTITNGVISAGVTLTGAIAGTGDYANSNGDVTLSYSSDNSVAPPTYLFGTLNRWSDNVSGDVFFNTATNFEAVFALDVIPSELRSCDAIGVNTADVVTAQTGRVRSFTTPAVTGCANGVRDNGRVVAGYLTSYTSSGGTQDDRLMIVVSNDNYSFVGILPCFSGTCF